LKNQAFGQKAFTSLAWKGDTLPYSKGCVFGKVEIAYRWVDEVVIQGPNDVAFRGNIAFPLDAAAHKVVRKMFASLTNDFVLW
jgi:hypothetical protein